MRRGFLRGLLIGIVSAVLIALYQWLRYRPDTFAELSTRISNGVFQIGLIYLIIGVVVFSRLFSFRRRMGVPNYLAMMKFKTIEEKREYEEANRALNERDAQSLRERGRDITMLISALLMIVVSIAFSVNQL
ncbi:hypothetical protein [Tumebacillus flagellatus]|uniref:DUF3899 domain-containing protein n=1 Tax=Tumebacillus flagellatus TaxID=1157490 RepID=A0A074ME28_9BACL|nr:hypothetical protein [Tumebacillus flagellatus]KEO84077.1 hypothetical protein EL26_06330 [Tumebacillus flagellatus]